MPGRLSGWLTLVLRSAPLRGLQQLQPPAAAEPPVEGEQRLM